MKILLAILLATATFTISTHAQTVKLKANDLKIIEGGQWIGNLTYLDYTSKKRTTIKSNVTITRSPSDDLSWTFNFQYPLEPSSNSTETVKLEKNGTILDGESVLDRRKMPNGVLMIVTTKQGKDDDRDATFRFKYLISKDAFSIRKEVRFDSSEEFFERNVYSWTR